MAILDVFALGFRLSVPTLDVLFLDNVILIKSREDLTKQMETRGACAVVLRDGWLVEDASERKESLNAHL
jgi:hypothetical protein